MGNFKTYLLLLFIGFPDLLFSQKDSSHFFIQADAIAGKIVPNYTNNFPENNFYRGVTLNFGWQTNGKKPWHYHYNLPKTGIAIAIAQPGNNDVFGTQINVFPFITINATKNKNKIFDFKFGIGASYFTKYYDSITNPLNLDVGSHFSWFFYAFMNHQWKINDFNDGYFGAGFMHSSNGHTQLPNYGLNSAMLSLGVIHYFSERKFLQQKYFADTTNNHWGIWLRSSVGFHERGSTTRPIGGEKYGVYSHAAGITFTYRDFTRFRGGFCYKFYDSYYDFILNDSISYKNPKLESSAFSFYLGTEFLIGRISIDIEGALHLYRPFYKRFYDIYEHSSKFDYFLKNTFVTRLGLNVFLFRFEEKRKLNPFFGTHINANFGQADFTDFSVGAVWNF